MFNLSRRLLNFFRDGHHWEKMTFFSGVSIFQGLSARQLGRITQAMQHRYYHAGEKLFNEGDVGKAVFIIESGSVELSRKTPSGQLRSLAILGPGQIFGEMALFENCERTASAEVQVDGRIHFLYTVSLDALMDRHPDIGVIVLRNLGCRIASLLRRANKQIDNHYVPASDL